MNRYNKFHPEQSVPCLRILYTFLAFYLAKNDVFSFTTPSSSQRNNQGTQQHFYNEFSALNRIKRSTLSFSPFAAPRIAPYASTSETDRLKLRVKSSISAYVVSTNSTYTDSSTRVKKRRHYKRRPANNVKTMFRNAKDLERKGQWQQSRQLLLKILERHPRDAHSHLALARLEAKRERKRQINVSSSSSSSSSAHTVTTSTTASNRKAQRAFERGTKVCPESVHLWQAWAVYEESYGNIERARELYETALKLDPINPYVCHAFGLMEKKQGNWDKAQTLWERALNENSTKNHVKKKERPSSTAALVCSLGELLIGRQEYLKARALYQTHLMRLQSDREKTEVYLAAAWLEERYLSNFDRAQDLIHLALRKNPSSSLAQVAMARLKGRRRQRQEGDEGTMATVRQLAETCAAIEDDNNKLNAKDGRVFNAWANLEVRNRNFSKARKILRRGLGLFPRDHSLLQAAGKVEERVGNFTGARDLYSASLSIEPSAPTLVAYAMLEMRHPEIGDLNYTRVKQLFEEAILLDPRHGPAYNAYGNAEYKRGNIEEARRIFERGVRSNCSDSASIFHGYGKLELSLGNVDTAREILLIGWNEVQLRGVGMDSPHRARAQFLLHTLGMLELNSDRPSEALEVFKDGIQSFGNSSQLLLGAALCESRLGKDDSARTLFEMSVVKNNKHAQAWQAWGSMEMRAGNFKTADTLFQCGIKSAPWYGSLYEAYATMESRLGNTEKARTLFANGIKRCPAHVPLYQGCATLELREGNFSTARRLITEALTRNKRNGMGWLIASQIERSSGNDGLVGLVLRRGIECAPNYAELYRALGDHLVEKGQIADAREIFEKGIELNPLHASLYHSLAELEAMVCNIEGLAKLNERAAELFKTNALQSTPSTSKAWGRKIRAGRSREVPEGVAALAQKIVDDEGNSAPFAEDLDPNTVFENLSVVEDELVSDLLNMDLSKGKKPSI